jgi:transposase
MIDPQLRQAILTLHAQQTPIRQIARLLGVSRNTVRRLLRTPQAESPHEPTSQGEALPSAGPLALEPEAPAACPPELEERIRELFVHCRGNVVRVAEELASTQDPVAYSTLTRWVRRLGLRDSTPRRAGRYTFGPGEEMQHDTSPHRVVIAEHTSTAQCAALVLAYSRRLYIEYFPRFTRFEAKVFLDHAFRFLAGTCPRCVIDNTHVFISSGSGPDAIVAPEMEAFGRIYAVRFVAHPIRQPDRKARVERPFAYVENNFLAGRTFCDWADLNRQALRWCHEVANPKPKRSLGMSPEAAFLMEKPHLQPLPRAIPPVFVTVERMVDVEGYVCLDTHRYSVPERFIAEPVEVRKLADRVEVWRHGRCIAEHDRVLVGRETRVTDPSHHRPLTRRNAHRGPPAEHTALQGHDPVLDRYSAELARRAYGRGVRPLRKLLELFRTYPRTPFLAAVTQAHRYRLYDLARLEQLILQHVAGDVFQLPFGEDDGGNEIP